MISGQSRTLYAATMWLDGFIAGPEGDMSWTNRHPGARDPVAAELMDQAGRVPAGRRSHVPR